MRRLGIFMPIILGALIALFSIMVLNTSLYLISMASSVANCIGVILPVIWAGFIWVATVPIFKKLFDY